jgi:hypothetical protein
VAKTPKPDSAEVTAETSVAAPVTKGRPTPTRKEREAARKQPLVPSDRRLAARKSREQAALQREKARIGMARGDQNFLPARDRGEQKKYVRDFVDARFSLGEALVPVLLVAVLVSLVPAVASYAFIALYGVIIIVIADGIYLGFTVKRKLADKFGAEKVERGVRWYAFMRAIQLRPMRLPKPQVKRGNFPS